MVAPSFFCQSETANGLLLRYRSRRRGFVPYVIGQIREVARLYYDTAVTVQVLSADGEPETVEGVDDDEAGTESSQDRELRPVSTTAALHCAALCCDSER